jgi:hypothetical protein
MNLSKSWGFAINYDHYDEIGKGKIIEELKVYSQIF